MSNTTPTEMISIRGGVQDTREGARCANCGSGLPTVDALDLRVKELEYGQTNENFLRDMCRLVEALGMECVARPVSPKEVMQECIERAEVMRDALRPDATPEQRARYDAVTEEVEGA